MTRAVEKWTKTSLGQVIDRFKENSDLVGLTSFLKARLVDHDPFCVCARPMLWNELGVTAVSSEKFTLAGICFENALELEPGYVDARNNLTILSC